MAVYRNCVASNGVRILLDDACPSDGTTVEAARDVLERTVSALRVEAARREAGNQKETDTADA